MDELSESSGELEPKGRKREGESGEFNGFEDANEASPAARQQQPPAPPNQQPFNQEPQPPQQPSNQRPPQQYYPQPSPPPPYPQQPMVNPIPPAYYPPSQLPHSPQPGYGAPYAPPGYGVPYHQPTYGGPAPHYPYPGPYHPQQSIDPNNLPLPWIDEWNKIPEDQGWLWALFMFNGRLERKRYIIGTVGLIVLAIAMWVAIIMIAKRTGGSTGLTVFFFGAGITLLFAWPTAGLSMKRLRDMNEEPLLALVFILSGFIPCIGDLVRVCMWIWMCAQEGTFGPNKYGPDPIERESLQ